MMDVSDVDAAARSRDLAIYPRSVVRSQDAVFALARRDEHKFVLAIARSLISIEAIDGSATTCDLDGVRHLVKVGECHEANARALRTALPSLAPRPFGLRSSAGCGDRLGLATPGHIRAFRSSSLAPVLAQQSMRENSRTGRTLERVIDDAMWGVLQEGWLDGYGADADHLKTLDDLERCAIAGYTMFTIDPSEHVNNAAQSLPNADLDRALARLAWTELETSWNDTRRRLAGTVELSGGHVQIDEDTLARAAVKYAPVIAHTVTFSRRLASLMGDRPFDLEMSIDESDTVTTTAEHVYIAAELRRLGVRWTSLAPRYVGEFEKGVDFIGDLDAFAQSFSAHLAVAQRFGPYKLSLHSGSDKFTVFPIAARLALRPGSGQALGGIHLKTAGTSYLEALRVASRIDPELFRDIAMLARERYPADRLTYHVSATAGRMPDPHQLPPQALPALLDDFDGREILHVTFGSVIKTPALRDRLLATLRAHEDAYYEALRVHFERHFAPFEKR